MNFGRFHRVRLAVLVVVCLSAAYGCGRTPQVGDEECLKAADALWTAVTARRSDLLEASADRIGQLHDSARLPQDAFDRLSPVIETARAGRWAEARASLKAFIRGQRPALAK